MCRYIPAYVCGCRCLAALKLQQHRPCWGTALHAACGRQARHCQAASARRCAAVLPARCPWLKHAIMRYAPVPTAKGTGTHTHAHAVTQRAPKAVRAPLLLRPFSALAPHVRSGTPSCARCCGPARPRASQSGRAPSSPSMPWRCCPGRRCWVGGWVGGCPLLRALHAAWPNAPCPAARWHQVLRLGAIRGICCTSICIPI